MKTPEYKIAEQLVNLTESQWFNPAVFGRVLSEQPHYTTDRIMEMIVHTIKQLSIRYDNDLEHGQTSHGLVLANEMHYAINSIRELEDLSNLKLPTSAKSYTKSLPEPPSQEYRYSFIHGKQNMSVNQVQAVL